MKAPRFNRTVLPVTGSVAAAILATSCGPSTDTATSDIVICRDAGGRRIPDADCDRPGGGGGHYYIARGGGVPAVGEPVNGGSDTPRTGVSYGRASEATVARGGFGGSGEGAGE